MMQISALRPCIGVLLAGGLARRLGGGDKALRQLAGRPLLAHAIDRLAPQLDGLVLNANGDAARFAAFGLPVAADSVAGFPGPLAGILAGLDWAAAQRPDCRWVFSASVDCPFLPADLVARLSERLVAEEAEIAVAGSGDRVHPVVGLWPVDIRETLRRAIAEDGLRKVEAWTNRFRMAVATFPVMPHDPFFNVNTPEDLTRAEALLAAGA